ncbi:hypothetical protein NIES4075_40120 [Tolypothrix sp. NIES-4075]|nr:hypothetical protein NIES4075_40120 [Tolypothrix sp. NIES-4075]
MLIQMYWLSILLPAATPLLGECNYTSIPGTSQASRNQAVLYKVELSCVVFTQVKIHHLLLLLARMDTSQEL